MANINIQSLFADIISTPEQREDKLLKEGMLQGQLLASGLKGRAANLAPLAQIAGQLGVQRQENLKRVVQPMLGIDPRTTGEKMAERLSNIDISTPKGLLQAAKEIENQDPVRAAALRQESVNLTRANAERARTIRRQNEADARATAAEARAERAETRAQRNAILNNARTQQQIDAYNEQQVLSEEEETRLTNQKNLVVNAIARSNPDYAEIIRTSNMNSIQLTDAYESFTQSPEIKTSIQQIRGADILKANPDLQIDNLDGMYNVMIRTNEGSNPANNPRDRIGAIISFVGGASGTAASLIPEKQKSKMINMARQDFAQYINAGASEEEIAQEIYDKFIINDIPLKDAKESVLNNYRMSKPRAAKVDNDALKDPSIIHPSLSQDFFKSKRIKKNDDLEFNPITQDQIDSGMFEGLNFKPVAGDLLMSYPNRLENLQLDKDPNTGRVRYNQIHIPR